jgi:hypothetical protein
VVASRGTVAAAGVDLPASSPHCATRAFGERELSAQHRKSR